MNTCTCKILYWTELQFKDVTRIVFMLHKQNVNLFCPSLVKKEKALVYLLWLLLRMLAYEERQRFAAFF